MNSDPTFAFIGLGVAVVIAVLLLLLAKKRTGR